MQLQFGASYTFTSTLMPVPTADCQTVLIWPLQKAKHVVNNEIPGFPSVTDLEKSKIQNWIKELWVATLDSATAPCMYNHNSQSPTQLAINLTGNPLTKSKSALPRWSWTDWRLTEGRIRRCLLELGRPCENKRHMQTVQSMEWQHFSTVKSRVANKRSPPLPSPHFFLCPYPFPSPSLKSK